MAKKKPAAKTPRVYTRILSAALDEDDRKNIVLRGRIDPSTLNAILFDEYQREVLSEKTIDGIVKGYEQGKAVPDVVLGVRGHKTKDDGVSWVLLSDVYCIDGQQRLTAAKRFLESGGTPRLGATVYFGTNREWETEYFHMLNTAQNKVSPNVLLRNCREKFSAVQLMINLCEQDKTFVLHDHVSWRHSKLRRHLIGAATLLQVANRSHAHLGLVGGQKTDDIVKATQQICDKVGRNTFRDNVKTFWQLLEDCWGIRTVTYAGSAHLKLTFLFSIAKLLSNHEAFWRENKLFIEATHVRKLKQFPIQDPTVQQLAGAGGQARKMLYSLLVDHVNKGKSTRRLVPRVVEEEPRDKPEIAD